MRLDSFIMFSFSILLVLISSFTMSSSPPIPINAGTLCGLGELRGVVQILRATEAVQGTAREVGTETMAGRED
jgi:hypothetical protein